jgi:hypothetical protein
VDSREEESKIGMKDIQEMARMISKLDQMTRLRTKWFIRKLTKKSEGV